MNKLNFQVILSLILIMTPIIFYNNCSTETSKVSTYKSPLEKLINCQNQVHQKTQGLSSNLSETDLLEQRDLNLFQIPNTGNWEDVSSDELRSQQVYLDHLNAEEAHQIVYDQWPSHIKPIVVAVIDTGVDHTHPDLINQMYQDQSGQIIGYDFVDNDTNAMDIKGHGTHVAGLIAAEGHNNTGVRGGAPEYVKIMPIRIIGPKGASTANIKKGLDFAINNKADIINMSLGATRENTDHWREIFNIQEELQRAANQGIITTIASGNEGVELNNRMMTYPAVFGSEMEGVITVGAYNVADVLSLAPFSNFSSTHVELQAPGSVKLNEELLSTCLTSYSDIYCKKVGLLSTCLTSSSNIYCKKAGTSMATPLTAALAALIKLYLKKNNFQLSASEVERLLKESSDEYQSLIQLGQKGRAINYKSTMDRLVEIYDSGILEHPKNLRLGKGQNGRLIAKMDSYDPDLELQWYHNGQPIDGAQEIELILKAVSQEDEGNYHLEIKKISGDVISSLAAEVQIQMTCL